MSRRFETDKMDVEYDVRIHLVPSQEYPRAHDQCKRPHYNYAESA